MMKNVVFMGGYANYDTNEVDYMVFRQSLYFHQAYSLLLERKATFFISVHIPTIGCLKRSF